MAFLLDTKLLAENIKYFRKREGYSISKLASLATLAPHVIQALEGGASTPSTAQLDRVARALQVKSEQLVLPRPPEVEYYESC